LTTVEVVARPMVRAQVALWRHLPLPVLLQNLHLLLRRRRLVGLENDAFAQKVS
jgi:hypothetical protein